MCLNYLKERYNPRKRKFSQGNDKIKAENKGRPNAQVCGVNEGDVGAGPSTSASDLARSREISKTDFRSDNRQ